MDPLIPASMHTLPQRYDIANRLWQTAFHLLLERFRCAVSRPASTASSFKDAGEGESFETVWSECAARSPTVLDHLTDFIYYAYTFYTHLLEEQSLLVFSSAWLEQLGDVARYKMAVAGLTAHRHDAKAQSPIVSAGSPISAPLVAIRVISNANVAAVKAISIKNVAAAKSLLTRQSRKAKGRGQPARIDDDDLEDAETPGGDSIGVAALNEWELEEQETWRLVARDWYNKGLLDTPGTGRLHHHLALLCKDDGLRRLYHYAKR